jgi:hypothetical protein
VTFFSFVIFADRMLREFRQKLIDEGWFESSKLWYLYKTTEVLGLSLLGVYLASLGHWVIGAILLGLGYQQQGWLSHDYCHQQVRLIFFLRSLVSRAFFPPPSPFSLLPSPFSLLPSPFSLLTPARFLETED